jgi:hypothetical protein
MSSRELDSAHCIIRMSAPEDDRRSSFCVRVPEKDMPAVVIAGFAGQQQVPLQLRAELRYFFPINLRLGLNLSRSDTYRTGRDECAIEKAPSALAVGVHRNPVIFALSSLEYLETT